MISNNITYYRPGELQRGLCACCATWRNDVIINEGLCVACFDLKTESIERISKTLHL